jgi:hypothetical protein
MIKIIIYIINDQSFPASGCTLSLTQPDDSSWF